MKSTSTRDHHLLRGIPLFAHLSDEKIHVLGRAVQHRSYKRASTILSVGTRADGVYILVAGRAKAVIEDAQGRAMTLSVIDTNEFFGSMGLPEPYETGSGVEALEACEVLYIPAQAFLAGIDRNYDAAMLIVRGVQARLCKAQQKVASLGLVDVYGRVARLLIDSARQVDGEWLVETGSEEIARTVAASREMVSRVVRKLKKQGLVRKDKRMTVILDRDSMAAACP